MAAIWQWQGARSSLCQRLISGSSTRSTTASGTTVSSTTCTPSPDPLERERPLVVVEEDVGEGLDKDTTMELIRGLVEEFFGGTNGEATAPNRWLSELNVAWLLHLGASARGIFISQRLVQSWVMALRVIINTSIKGFYSQEHTHKVLVSTRSRKEVKDFYMVGSKMSKSRKEQVKEHGGRLLARDFYMAMTPRYGGQDQDEATVVEPPAASKFVRFVQATLLKMLTFVDVIAAPLNVVDEKLRALLQVRDALCAASEQICLMQESSTRRITEDLISLLSAQLGKLDQAVCDTVYHIRTAVLSSLDDNSSWATLPGSSPDIHKVTRAVIECIQALSTKMRYTDAIIGNIEMFSENCASHYGDIYYLSTTIMEMVYSLEEKLARISKSSFPDQSIRFIFLINNFYFMRQELQAIRTLGDLITCFLNSLTHKLNIYITSYLQVSWAPVLNCLRNPTFHCCTTRDAPLPKFESKLQATCAAQKLWKVPDPELRKRLREAIIEIVVSGFTEYLEDNNRITPGVTQKVEDKLQELFEG